jgi:hypothetical protein
VEEFTMQRRKHQHCPRATQLILAAACGAPLLGCSSEHLLGDLPRSDLQKADETGYSGDGRQDFLASAELGPPDLMLEQNVTISPPEMGAANIGDVDGDGFDDFATYDPYRDTGLLSNIHIRYGRPRPERTADAFEWAESGGRLALAVDPEPDTGRLIGGVQRLGDLDGDGYADFLVSTGRCGQREQLAFVVYGRPQRLSGVSLLSEAAVALKGPWVPGQESACGGGVSHDIGLGDFNGDGFDDFVLTDPDDVVYANDNRTIAERYTGGTYLFYGGPHRIVSGTSWTQADVKIGAPGSLEVMDFGDLDGDGLADLTLEGWDEGGKTSPLYWLPGQTQKLPPHVNLEGAEIATNIRRVERAGDLDGDGRNDLLLYGEDDAPRLLYGHSGMFDAPLYLADADASFVPYPEQAPYVQLTPIPDRDGDGDDELVSSLLLSGIITGPQLLAVLSGSSARASGAIQFPEPSNPVPQVQSFIERIFPVGDLDGDGAGDLLTLVQVFPQLDVGVQLPPSSDSEAWQPLPTYSLNIHFGTPGGSAAKPVR